MTSEELEVMAKAWYTNRLGTHWDGCHTVNGHHLCAIQKLVGEVKRLRAEVAEKDETVVRLSKELTAITLDLIRSLKYGVPPVADADSLTSTTYHG